MVIFCGYYPGVTPQCYPYCTHNLGEHLSRRLNIHAPEQCLSLFFSLFDAGIPWAVIGIAVLLASLVSCAIYCKYKRITRTMVTPWIVACLFLMVYTAVLRRTSQPEYSIRLMPFWSIQAIQEGYIETMYEKIYNVLFFVPYGCLLGFRSFRNRVSCFRGFKGAVLIGFLTSVGIELLQLITRTGTCETDDVICNTVGCGVGTIVVYGLRFMVYGGGKMVQEIIQRHSILQNIRQSTHR